MDDGGVISSMAIAEDLEGLEKQYRKEPSSVILWDTYERPAWKVTFVSSYFLKKCVYIDIEVI